MKKFLILLLATIVTIGLGSCERGKKGPDKNNKKAEQQQKQQERQERKW